MEGLVALPGIGPKMANLILTVAWGRIEGIAVDVHVHRIANRLGWVQTSTPAMTEYNLEEMIPPEMWHDVNSMLVGFGQQRCSAVSPKCETCLVSSMCPEGQRQLKKKQKRLTGSRQQKSGGILMDGATSRKLAIPRDSPKERAKMDVEATDDADVAADSGDTS
eukprot:Selendium_serpulae@DN5554_c0_g1_i2.p2